VRLLDAHSLRTDLEIRYVTAPLVHDPVSIKAFNLTGLELSLAILVLGFDLSVLSFKSLILIEKLLNKFSYCVTDNV